MALARQTTWFSAISQYAARRDDVTFSTEINMYVYGKKRHCAKSREVEVYAPVEVNGSVNCLIFPAALRPWDGLSLSQK
jgi:hypothetical protein